jgi:hypothetical protein
MKSALLFLLLACGFAYASDNSDDGIEKGQWNALKKAVFKKMGSALASEFDQRYPTPSKEGIETLARELDYIGQKISWTKTKAPQSGRVVWVRIRGHLSKGQSGISGWVRLSDTFDGLEESETPELVVTVNGNRIHGLKRGTCARIICELHTRLLAENSQQ